MTKCCSGVTGKDRILGQLWALQGCSRELTNEHLTKLRQQTISVKDYVSGSPTKKKRNVIWDFGILLPNLILFILDNGGQEKGWGWGGLRPRLKRRRCKDRPVQKGGSVRIRRSDWRSKSAFGLKDPQLYDYDWWRVMPRLIEDLPISFRMEKWTQDLANPGLRTQGLSSGQSWTPREVIKEGIDNTFNHT